MVIRATWATWATCLSDTPRVSPYGQRVSPYRQQVSPYRQRVSPYGQHVSPFGQRGDTGNGEAPPISSPPPHPPVVSLSGPCLGVWDTTQEAVSGCHPCHLGYVWDKGYAYPRIRDPPPRFSLWAVSGRHECLPGQVSGRLGYDTRGRVGESQDTRHTGRGWATRATAGRHGRGDCRGLRALRAGGATAGASGRLKS